MIELDQSIDSYTCEPSWAMRSTRASRLSWSAASSTVAKSVMVRPRRTVDVGEAGLSLVYSETIAARPGWETTRTHRFGTDARSSVWAGPGMMTLVPSSVYVYSTDR